MEWIWNLLKSWLENLRGSQQFSENDIENYLRADESRNLEFQLSRQDHLGVNTFKVIPAKQFLKKCPQHFCKLPTQPFVGTDSAGKPGKGSQPPRQKIFHGTIGCIFALRIVSVCIRKAFVPGLCIKTYSMQTCPWFAHWTKCRYAEAMHECPRNAYRYFTCLCL